MVAWQFFIASKKNDNINNKNAVAAVSLFVPSVIMSDKRV